MRMTPALSDDRGTSAILVAASLLILFGFAALVVDIGAGFNERAQDQSAADAAALAGALEATTPGGVDAVVTKALELAADNLPTTYSAAEWQTLWETCTDPDRPASYKPVTYTPWSSTLDCISIDPTGGFFRVRIPDQIVDTTFGAVLGVNELRTSAAAVAKLTPRGVGGVLPFGLTALATEGSIVCLSSAPTGLANDPCTGPASGNFGTIKGRQFGDPSIPTPENCNASPLGDTLAMNIAVGLDHWVTLSENPTSPSFVEVRDECFNLAVNTLNTDTGFPNKGAAEGLATGPVNLGHDPRLQQGGNSMTNISGHPLDDRPLWAGYLLPEGTDLDPGAAIDPLNYDNVDAPVTCRPDYFDDSLPTEPDWNLNGLNDDPATLDWDGDGNPNNDRNESWRHMLRCMEDFVNGGYSIPIFTADLASSPRFGYVPQFWQNTLGNGNSWLNIKRFKAIWIQTTWWKKGNNWHIFDPGEPCPGCSAPKYAMKQVSALIIPDAMLPSALRGNPPPFNGGLDPYSVELYR